MILTFKGLKEGIQYSLVGDSRHKYRVKNGLLVNSETNRYSQLSFERVAELLFKEDIHLTKETKHFLQAFDDELEWIAIDEDASIHAFAEKPYKDKDSGCWDSNYFVSDEIKIEDYLSNKIQLRHLSNVTAYNISLLIEMG